MLVITDFCNLYKQSFGFEGRIWDLIVSVPDHCLSFYFSFFFFFFSWLNFSFFLRGKGRGTFLSPVHNPCTIMKMFKYNMHSINNMYYIVIVFEVGTITLILLLSFNLSFIVF